jgi:hypothetical protein
MFAFSSSETDARGLSTRVQRNYRRCHARDVADVPSCYLFASECRKRLYIYKGFDQFMFPEKCGVLPQNRLHLATSSCSLGKLNYFTGSRFFIIPPHLQHKSFLRFICYFHHRYSTVFCFGISGISFSHFCTQSKISVATAFRSRLQILTETYPAYMEPPLQNITILP